MLATPAGKPAAVSVIRSRRTDPETVNVNREIVQAPPVEAKMLEDNIAYLKIPYLAAGKGSGNQAAAGWLAEKGRKRRHPRSAIHGRR